MIIFETTLCRSAFAKRTHFVIKVIHIAEESIILVVPTILLVHRYCSQASSLLLIRVLCHWSDLLSLLLESVFRYRVKSDD